MDIKAENVEQKTNEQNVHYTTINTQISQIGLWYDCHGNQACCKVYFENMGGCCHIDFENLGAFIYKVFGKDKDVDFENGLFIESLKGKYVRVIIDESRKLVGIMNIIYDGQYYMFNGKK